MAFKTDELMLQELNKDEFIKILEMVQKEQVRRRDIIRKEKWDKVVFAILDYCNEFGYITNYNENINQYSNFSTIGNIE